jgi:ribosome recycling factor
MMKLKQVALITTPEPRMIVVQPFDASTVQAIEKALKESRIGINPNVDGKIIRLPIPALTEERRRELVKGIKHMAEESRVRNSERAAGRSRGAEEGEKGGGITEDEVERYEKDVQKLTDEFVKKIEDALNAKEADIMKV